MSKQIVSFFTNISKFDEETRIVGGYASTEAIDCQGEIITKDAMIKAFPDYMKFANIREMHTDSAVGLVKNYFFDNIGTYIEVEVVDDNAWKKVTKGVYKGFSIGGAVVKKIGNTITDLMLVEISLVDRPANPLALINTSYKSADIDKLTGESLILAKRYDDKIPEVEIIEKAEDDSKDKKNKEDKNNNSDDDSNDNIEETEEDKKKKEDETKKSKMLEDLEKSGLSFDDILELVNKSKKEKEDKEKEELSKKQEALMAKGFYDVQDVISAISALNWVLDNQEWESKWNNDSNPEILISIKDHIISLSELAKQIIDNETKDLTPELISLSEKLEDIKKFKKTEINKEENKEVDNLLNDINKSAINNDLQKSLDLKDEEIKSLKEELESIKKNAIFDKKPEVKTVEKTISSNDISKSFEDINKDIDEEISSLKEEISKCKTNEKSSLEKKLMGLKLRKSQISIFK